MKSHVLWALGKISNKKNFEVSFLNSILTIFKEKKMETFQIDWYTTLTIGIDIIGFSININSELVFTIILYLFLFHVLLEGGY